MVAARACGEMSEAHNNNHNSSVLNSLLDPDEVRRLNQAAKEFAAGINFSIKTDNLPPLTGDTALDNSEIDVSNSTSDDSLFSSKSKTDYKSEALRLRVKVTALEEEVYELQAILARNATPANEYLQKHVEQVRQTHLLQVELERQRCANEQQQALQAVLTAEERAAEATSKLADLQARFDRMVQDQALSQKEFAQQRAEASAALEQVRAANAKIELLEQRVDFVSRDRQERLAERDKQHDRDLDHVVARYSKMLGDLKKTHTQLQQQYIAATQDPETVTVRFVNSGDVVGRSSSTVDAHSRHHNEEKQPERNDGNRSSLISAAEAVRLQRADDLERSRFSVIDQDGEDAWDGVRAALSLAKLSHEQLTQAKHNAEKQAGMAAKVTAEANSARLQDVERIQSFVGSMLQSFSARMQECLSAVNKVLVDQHRQIQQQHREKIALVAAVSRRSPRLVEHIEIDSKVERELLQQTSRCMDRTEIIEKSLRVTQSLAESNAVLSNGGVAVKAQKTPNARDIANTMDLVCECLCQVQRNRAHTISTSNKVNNVVLSMVRKLHHTQGNGASTKYRDSRCNDSSRVVESSNPSTLPALALDLVQAHEEKQDLQLRLQKAEQTSKATQSHDAQLQQEAAEQLRNLITTLESKDSQLSDALEHAQELQSKVESLQQQIQVDREMLQALEHAKKRAVQAEKAAAVALAAELEATAVEQQKKQQQAADSALELANQRLMEAAREHAAEAGANVAEISTLQRQLCWAQEAVAEAEAECGTLEGALAGHNSKVERLTTARNEAARKAAGAEAARLALETNQQQIHHDWCASKAALANLEVEAAALQQQLDVEKAARAAAHRAALHSQAEQQTLRREHEAQLHHAREIHRQQAEAARHTFQKEIEDALRTAGVFCLVSVFVICCLYAVFVDSEVATVLFCDLTLYS